MQISPNRRRHTFGTPDMNHLLNHSKGETKGRNGSTFNICHHLAQTSALFSIFLETFRTQAIAEMCTCEFQGVMESGACPWRRNNDLPPGWFVLR